MIKKLFVLVASVCITTVAMAAATGSGNTSNIMNLFNYCGQIIYTLPTSSWSGGAGGKPALKMLTCGNYVGMTAYNFSPCYDPSSSTPMSNYQVSGPSGTKTFKVLAVEGLSSTAVGYGLVTATASIGFNAGSLTGGVYYSGSTATATNLVTSTTASVFACSSAVGIVFPSNVFVGFQAGATQSFLIHIYGIEE